VTEQTVSRLIVASIVTVIACAIAIQARFLGDAIPKTYLQTLLMVAFCMAPLLIMIKIVSRLFLSGLKGKSVSFIETAFFFYYIFLTVEARAEWRCYIEEQNRKFERGTSQGHG